MNMMVETRLRLGKNCYSVGKGIREILDAIDEYKSIKKASEATGISYPKILRKLKIFENEFGFPAVISEKGGSQHGGSQLSEKGRAVLELYREIENETANFAKKLVCERFKF